MPVVEIAGARVHYLVDGSGPGLVLVHGTGGNAGTSWTPMLERLTARWTVVRPDYSGSGATRDDGGPLTLPGLARQVVAAAERAGLASFHLLGYSLGALVAVQAAADYPAQVRSLVALGGFVSGADPRLQMMLKFWQDLIARDRAAIARLWVLSGFSPAFLSTLTPAELEAIVELNLAVVDWDGVARQIGLDLTADVHGAAARVVAPTLVLGCRQDQMVPPAHARDLAACIPGAAYRELDSGHAAPVEAAGPLLDLVEPFFRAVEVESLAAQAAAR
jgi:pimeloyl-ACP methyl ester carboxylesterase